MPNNPVQVILNAASFIGDALAAGGGPNKDFFANRDSQFASHRSAIRAQLVGVQAHIASSRGDTAYVRVALRPDAWAKSHRPTSAVFKPEHAPVVGASDLGEVLVRISANSIASIVNTVDRAEPETRMAPGPNDRLVPKPSRARSEIGAIAEIQLYGASDRRQFTSSQSAQWLSDPRTGGLLLVQFFEAPGMKSGSSSSDSRYNELQRKLKSLDAQLELSSLSEWWTSEGFRALHLPSGAEAQPIHERVFSILDSETAVRRVLLPPIVVNSRAQVTAAASQSGSFGTPDPSRSYPVVGIIDTGVSEIPELNGWVVQRTDFLDPQYQDMHHGTFIAGLVSDEGLLNTHPELNESACKIFDLGLHATDGQQANDAYPNGFIDFLQQLEFEMQPAVDAGVRVFNMSLAIEELVRDDSYSPFAARMDDLADKYDAIFVLPTGNLEESQFREQWPDAPDKVLAMLANYRHLGRDRIFQPGESLRAVTVGALDPEITGLSAVRPSTYSRRGPGIGLGMKPEFAHLGGVGAEQTQLRSFNVSGEVVEDCGTSFSSPLVAKTLANIDSRIEGTVKRETVVALAVQGATLPESVAHQSLRSVARDFVGFGIPGNAQDLLSTDDDAITLVFESKLRSRKELDFGFQWPQALVGPGGKCRGSATLTLVYRPPVDLAYGSEAVRVNLEAFLRQEKIDGRTGEIKYEGFFKSKGVPVIERERVAHGQKWGAVKRWTRTSVGGVGTSSQWKLVVEPLARSGVQIPDEGIPFTAILTIRDPAGTAPVFNQMRRSLLAGAVQIADIRTSQRIRP